MARYVLPDATGLLPAFYSDEDHGVDVPVGALPISDEAWSDFLGHQGQRIWNPKTSTFDAFTPPPPPPALPEVISDRQCFQQLAINNHITQDEALAAVTVGALPKSVSDGIAALPADQQFGARMLLCGATEFHRSHPMVPVFLGFFGLNGGSDRDALWTAAAAL